MFAPRSINGHQTILVDTAEWRKIEVSSEQRTVLGSAFNSQDGQAVQVAQLAFAVCTCWVLKRLAGAGCRAYQENDKKHHAGWRAPPHHWSDYLKIPSLLTGD